MLRMHCPLWCKGGRVTRNGRLTRCTQLEWSLWRKWSQVEYKISQEDISTRKSEGSWASKATYTLLNTNILPFQEYKTGHKQAPSELDTQWLCIITDLACAVRKHGGEICRFRRAFIAGKNSRYRKLDIIAWSEWQQVLLQNNNTLKACLELNWLNQATEKDVMNDAWRGETNFSLPFGGSVVIRHSVLI